MSVITCVLASYTARVAVQSQNTCSTKKNLAPQIIRLRGQRRKLFYKLRSLQTQSTLFFRTRHGLVVKEELAVEYY